MDVKKSSTLHLTVDAFSLLYAAVSDMVFVYRLADGQITEGNPAFRASLGIALGAQFTIPFSQLQMESAPLHLAANTEILGSMQLAGRGAVAVQLQLLPLMLEAEAVLLGIAREQAATDTLSRALAAAELEKEALLKEVYHRVKNNLNIIISLMSLQMNRIKEPQLRKLLVESKGRVYALSLLQERLYQSPRLSEVKANEYLLSLAQSVLATYKDSKQQIKLLPETHECWLNVDVLVPLGLIVHELIANAVLHAYKEEEAGVLRLYFGPGAEDGEYLLMIGDSGQGLPQGVSYTSFTSLGVQLVVSLSRQLKGRLQVDSKPCEGLRVSLYFSLPVKHA